MHLLTWDKFVTELALRHVYNLGLQGKPPNYSLFPRFWRCLSKGDNVQSRYTAQESMSSGPDESQHTVKKHIEDKEQ